MKAFLMYRDRDFDLERELPANEAALTQDLELNTLFGAMAHGDQFLFDVAKKAVLSSLTDPEAILYRQHVLADCLEQPAVIREIYDIAVEAITAEKKVYFGLFKDSPDTILRRSLEVLELLVSALKRLRLIADEHASSFHSEGFNRFFAMLTEELNDEYFQTIEGHLKELRFRRGVLISAELGKGNKGAHYVLRRPREQSWVQRITIGDRSGYSFRIPDRDEGGFRALSELQGRGINLVANVLAQSVDHIVSFFSMLRAELAFYIGCLNLHECLTTKGEPTCFPVPLVSGTPALSACGLYDVCLTLNMEERVVGNDVNADNKWLVIITGANQGGKSTFLRSIGLAQLMMQCGMFVPAESFRANIVVGIFTHYKREEDATMRSGKLDEELSRMSEIADQITPNCILLCNESFASTNEREGSEIARQVVRALIETGIKVFFVTHLFDLAHGFYREQMDSALFLRAERGADGRRTFKLVEGEPLPTSYGEDLYKRIFGSDPAAVVEGAIFRGSATCNEGGWP
jgi:DNA mismatch repair ATPase MutS